VLYAVPPITITRRHRTVFAATGSRTMTIPCAALDRNGTVGRSGDI
jgi:hypothetical protein